MLQGSKAHVLQGLGQRYVPHLQHVILLHPRLAPLLDDAAEQLQQLLPRTAATAPGSALAARVARFDRPLRQGCTLRARMVWCTGSGT